MSKQKKNKCREMKLPQFIYPLFEQEALMIYDYLRLFHCLFPSLKNRHVLFDSLKKSGWNVPAMFQSNLNHFKVLRIFWWLSDNIVLTWVFHIVPCLTITPPSAGLTLRHIHYFLSSIRLLFLCPPVWFQVLFNFRLSSKNERHRRGLHWTQLFMESLPTS